MIRFFQYESVLSKPITCSEPIFFRSHLYAKTNELCTVNLHPSALHLFHHWSNRTEAHRIGDDSAYPLNAAFLRILPVAQDDEDEAAHPVDSWHHFSGALLIRTCIYYWQLTLFKHQDDCERLPEVRVTLHVSLRIVCNNIQTSVRCKLLAVYQSVEFAQRAKRRAGFRNLAEQPHFLFQQIISHGDF